ncbi:MAG: hypothetical protein V3V41_06965, partial [Candidatus Heimdallarchaeota archaeon]
MEKKIEDAEISMIKVVMVSRMTKSNKQTKSEKRVLFRLFTEPSKSQIWLNLISYSLLSLFLLFFLLTGLEGAFDKVEDFFKIASYEIWLIFILIPIGFATIAFVISYKFEKIRLKLFKFSIAGLMGFGLGFGLFTILYTTRVLTIRFGTLIGFFIILTFSL